MRGTTLASAVLAAALSGCGSATPGDKGDPSPACPSYATVPAGPGVESYDEYIVKFAEGSEAASDDRVRAERLDEIAATVCREVTVERELAVGAVLVVADREMAGPEQEAFVAAFEAAGDVEYAEPDYRVHPAE